MRLLLISNSTNAGEAYLDYPKKELGDFFKGIDEVMFVPYAAVTFTYDAYLEKVQARFSELGIRVRSVHREANPALAIMSAKGIVVGGGNTFRLAQMMQREGLVEAIRLRVTDEGIPYAGWSAGSNMACPTIGTTNDMPIIEPATFHAAGLIPFQINPHYLDAHPQGHAGETREQRIEEYITVNTNVYVAGLREGCMLRLEGDRLSLIGPRPMRIFRWGELPREVNPGDDLGFLLQQSLEGLSAQRPIRSVSTRSAPEPRGNASRRNTCLKRDSTCSTATGGTVAVKSTLSPGATASCTLSK